MNIDFQKAKQYGFYNVSKKKEITEDFTLNRRILYLGANVDIYANVVCEDCEIQIGSNTQIDIEKNASLKLKNCVVKGAESGGVWRSKNKYRCFVHSSGIMEFEQCRIENLTIDSTEQWAVRSTGRIALDHVNFYDCIGNFFSSGPKFLAEHVKTENFSGQFFSNLEDPSKVKGSMSKFWIPIDDKDKDEKFKSASFLYCDFNFAPRKKYNFSVPPFMEFMDVNVMEHCNFTAQGDSDQWNSCCLSLVKSVLGNCTFNGCVKILSKKSEFEDYSFVHSKLCQK